MEKKTEFISRKYSQRFVSEVVTRALASDPVQAGQVFQISRRTIRDWIDHYQNKRLQLEEHIHHWICPPVTGPEGVAVCRGCLEERIVKNFTPGAADAEYDSDIRRGRPIRR